MHKETEFIMCGMLVTIMLHPWFVEQVIMYDEPTAGLDPVASTVVEDLVRSMRVRNHESPLADQYEDGGIAAYIVVTHQHSTIRRSVDRIVFLHEVGSGSW